MACWGDFVYIKSFITKYLKTEQKCIDAFEIFDDLEELLGKVPDLKSFNNVINELKNNFNKIIINYEEVLSIEYENEIDIIDYKKEFFLDNYDKNIQLLRKYKETKDIEIRNKIIVYNLKLIAKYANYYSRISSLEYEDLINEGVIGIIEAIEKFDIKKNTRFSTYAVYWIRQKIRRAVQEKGNFIRIPVHVLEKIEKLTLLENKYLSNGLEIDREHICQILSISEEQYLELKKIRKNFIDMKSINCFVGEDDLELIEFIVDKEEETPENILIQKLMREDIKSVIETLTYKEQKVICLRFGLNDDQPRTLEEVGREFSLTRERIRQIEVKAIRKLRHPSRSKKIRDYI